MGIDALFQFMLGQGPTYRPSQRDRVKFQQLSGVGLVEWMIVLFLSSVMIMVLLNQVILTKKQEQMTTDALAKAYDLNMVGELMKTSIRQAGYTPCAVIGQLKSYDHTTLGAIPEAVTLDTKRHDGFTVYSMVPPLIHALEVIYPSQIRVLRHHVFSKDDTLMIADCFHAEVVSLSTIKSSRGDSLLTLKNHLQFKYTSPMYVGLWQSRRFFMKKNAEGLWRLYFQQKHAEVLSDWIEGMEVSQVVKAHVQLIHILLHLPDSDPWALQVSVRVV